MYQGLVLLYVGAVLILNGLWMLGRIDDREIGAINVLVGGVSLAVALRLAFGPDADPASVKAAALSLLFAFTYLWVAYNRYSGADGRGLGWFSLFVALTAVAVAAETLAGAATPWQLWSGLSWAAWAVLWWVFFLVLARGRPLARTAAWLAIAEGVTTGWIPGYLLLTGAIPQP
ncbi:AmiS/UreI family transporter [Oryzomicrobium sp.]|uniref:AmiS/UreI family transporter n=1 Tax=Oryzomicrobium sp. TaxID=1911578 RepID=UPI0025F948E9|nr:AmiS/UreI family transporter [Oryzomicrobium sp.]MCE1244560.1 AmiS/UreI family transporter [Oryzomicrobium sp.]